MDGRRRLIVKRIEDKKVRKATFERRKKGLLKKASEISTLCGVKACVIVFPPDELGEARAQSWPPDPKDVMGIIQKYENDKSSRNKPRTVKNYDLREFFNDRKKQVVSETSKVRRQRLDMSFPTWDCRFDNLGEDQLGMLVSALDSKVRECDKRIDDLSKKKQPQSQSQSQSQSQADNYYSEMNTLFENYYNPSSDLQNIGNFEDYFSLVNYGSNGNMETTMPLSTSLMGQSSSSVAFEDFKYEEPSFLQNLYYDHMFGTYDKWSVFPPLSSEFNLGGIEIECDSVRDQSGPAMPEELATMPEMMDTYASLSSEIDQ